MSHLINVVVDSSIRLHREELRSAGIPLRDVEDPFRYTNPDWYKKQRLGFWNGNTPRDITLVERVDDEIRLPRGVWMRLKAALASHLVEFQISDRTVLGRSVNYEWSAPFALDPDQRSAVKAMLTRRSGIVVGACGSGKTEIGVNAIALSGRRALVVVPTERILYAWKETCEARLRGAKVGLLYGKKKQPDADVVIALNKSLDTYVAKNPKWIETFGVVCLDEAHHFPATTFAGPILKFPARYRWALTATPERKDGKSVLFYDAFGSDLKAAKRGDRLVPRARVLYEITDEDLEKYGRIEPVDVVIVPTDFYFDLYLKDRMAVEKFEANAGESHLSAAKRFRKLIGGGPLGDWNDLLDAMTLDAYRQARVLEYLLPEIQSGSCCLLLSDRRENSLSMYAWLRRRKIECGRLMGGAQSKEQDRVAERLEEGDLKVAVGTTQIAGEGMNIKPLSAGFACTPTATNMPKFIQNMGRFKRRAPGKMGAHFYYFWDRRITGLVGHARMIFNGVGEPHRVLWGPTPDRSTWKPMTKYLLRELEKGK